MPYAKVQAERSAMDGRSQLGSRKGATDPCDTRRSEGTAGRCGKKDEGDIEKTASGGGLYTLRKRRVRRC